MVPFNIMLTLVPVWFSLPPYRAGYVSEKGVRRGGCLHSGELAIYYIAEGEFVRRWKRHGVGREQGGGRWTWYTAAREICVNADARIRAELVRPLVKVLTLASRPEQSREKSQITLPWNSPRSKLYKTTPVSS